MRDLGIFDMAVAKYFEPIAQKLKLPLKKISDGIYEIESSHFILCIRLATGHHRGLNAILRQASVCDFDKKKPNMQYDVASFMLFNGLGIESLIFDVNTDDEFLKIGRAHV